MAHKLPKPMVHIKCGTCFYDMTWSNTLKAFECTYCLTKMTRLDDGTFKTEYTDPNAEPCRQPPAESFRKIRHLRLNEKNERYFVVFTYVFFPCSLPKGHANAHYFHSAGRYSEETLEHVEYKVKDIKID